MKPGVCPALTAACVIAASGCSRTPAPAGVGASSPAESGAPAAASAQPSSLAFAASSAAQAGVLPDGCWSGFSSDVSATAEPGERLKALAERCAQGMKPLAPALATAVLGTGQSKRHEFEVQGATGCVRVLSVGGTGVTDLALHLFDRTETARGSDQLRAAFALAPAPGNVCLEPGKYHAVVSVTSGAGTVALSAYAAE